MTSTWRQERLWRERDWRRALERELAALRRGPADRAVAALALGEALEHIHPDRRLAIAAHAAAGPDHDRGRARALAIELGWWPALARLAAAGSAGQPHLVHAEVTAWLDAGAPDLAAAVLAGAPPAAPAGGRGGSDDLELDALAAALAGGDPVALAADLAAAAAETRDAELLVAAARLARLAGDQGAAYRWLVAALTHAPGHARATALLLELAGGDEGAIRELLQILLAELEPAPWIDRVRAIGTRLASRPGTRGLGLRLLRHALDRAYADGVGPVPGHLATWSLLAEHAASSGSRHDLVALAQRALAATADETDRVWLLAFGAEVAWRDDGDLDAARSWAALLAELAPGHPVVDDVSAAVAAADPAAALVYLDQVSTDLPSHGLAAMLRAAVLSAGEAAAAAAAPLADSTAALADDVAIDVEVDVEVDAEAEAEAAAEAAADAEADVEADVDEPAAPPPPAAPLAASLATIDAALAAAARAAATPATPPPAPPPAALIPRAAMGALGKLAGKPPALPVKPAPANARPRAPRIAVPLDVVVTTPDGATHAVVGRDISATGLFVLSAQPLPVGELVELVLRTPTAEPWREARHGARARVVRRESRGYGLELVEPTAALLAAIDRLDR